MEKVTVDGLKNLYRPLGDSHKGQNGRLLIIGGSHLFHAASLWSLEVASRIVDLVHYSSVPENNEIVQKIKEEFRNGMIVPREDLDSYIEEDDCILIGPGMTRDQETEELTNRLLKKYPQKQWVIDAGALQMMDINLIPKNAILTPHHGEFIGLWKKFAEVGHENFDPTSVSHHMVDIENSDQSEVEQNFMSSLQTLTIQAQRIAKEYQCIILLKGSIDLACNGMTGECREINGGNAGMTKGGTGDVLAGLIAALACKNDPWLATQAGSFINKQAGDDLYRSVGPYFNSSDLTKQIPVTMKNLFY